MLKQAAAAAMALARVDSDPRLESMYLAAYSRQCKRIYRKPPRVLVGIDDLIQVEEGNGKGSNQGCGLDVSCYVRFHHCIYHSISLAFRM